MGGEGGGVGVVGGGLAGTDGLREYQYYELPVFSRQIITVMLGFHQSQTQ